MPSPADCPIPPSCGVGVNTGNPFFCAGTGICVKSISDCSRIDYQSCTTNPDFPVKCPGTITKGFVGDPDLSLPYNQIRFIFGCARDVSDCETNYQLQIQGGGAFDLCSSNARQVRCVVDNSCRTEGNWYAYN